VGKRSPILGYNHNVRYRGLVFHVQTEDSGVSSPHLFTHLFHHGVIVSTRKLDYDAGSAEDSIRSLMQAQHKAVLKDLRRGVFDDKIDSYLGGTPGLLPRDAEEPPDRPSEIDLSSSSGAVMDLASGPPTEQMLPVVDDSSAPAVERTPVPMPARPIPPMPARTAERRSPVAVGRAPTRSATGPIDPAFATQRTPAPLFDAGDGDSSPEIEIQRSDAAVMRSSRQRHDTETELPLGDRARSSRPSEHEEQTRPTLSVPDELRRSSTVDLGPGPLRPPSAIPPAPADARRLGDRPSTINAATLPPARPISRPAARPAVSSPQVVSRPLAPDERSRRESEAVEVYSPAPPSAELPSAYAQNKQTGRVPLDGPKADRSPPVPIPAGLGRPLRPATAPAVKPMAVAPPIPPGVRASSHTEPLHNRTPAPRMPVTSRTSTATGGVVMTRPAVIVGAPHTPQKTTATVPRIRKAREDEGRGFGQGLISEKSLDEVILAYLSEDADEK